MSLGEFDIIQRYFKTPERNDVIAGIGDDGAVLQPPPGHELVIVTDTLVSGVHFDDALTPFDIAYKAMAVNLSDLAAMAAKPAWASLALTLPDAEACWLSEFSRGLYHIAEAYSVVLVGGDTTQGPLTVTVSLIGFVEQGKALYRSGAQVGDRIYVTGTLGDAALALQLQRSAAVPNCPDSLFKRLAQPTPRVQAGRVLQGYVSAAIDLSDGLVADLRRVVDSSGVGAEVSLQGLPLSNDYLQYADAESLWEPAISGGDDYELCFTVPVKHIDKVERALQEISCPYACIGAISAEKGMRLFDGQQLYTPRRNGYVHFEE